MNHAFDRINVKVPANQKGKMIELGFTKFYQQPLESTNYLILFCPLKFGVSSLQRFAFSLCK